MVTPNTVEQCALRTPPDIVVLNAIGGQPMSEVDLLIERIAPRWSTVGVIGLGYVGLPLILRFGEVGFQVIGFDVDAGKVKQLNDGGSYIQNISAARVQALLASGRV